MDAPRQLRRQVGLFGAMVLGLGSMLGTGVFFVSFEVAAGVGWLVFPAIALAGVLALCNGLSSAQLAANFPVSGGTYEYGYRMLHPAAGFAAGLAFLLAKSASAAAACLVLGGILDAWLRPDGAGGLPAVLLAAGILATLTAAVLLGLRRTQILNTLIVGAAVLALAAAGTLELFAGASGGFASPALGGGAGVGGVLEAAALVFVGYTGYGRVATMGEEIAEPRRNIPRAVVLTVLAAGALYALAAQIPFGGVDQRATAVLLRIGATIALLGIVLNLLLGLSRMLLAMSRRGDMPGLFARLSADDAPNRATLGVAALIGVLLPFSLLGGITDTVWSFSAFTVLVYYGFANASALRLSGRQRLYPPLVAIVGLAGCVGLLPFVRWEVAAAGLGILALGLLARALLGRPHPAS